MPTNFNQVRSIFMSTLELPADEWTGYVAKACGDDAALQEQVNILLEAHRSGRGMLDDAATRGPCRPTAASNPGG